MQSTLPPSSRPKRKTYLRSLFLSILFICITIALWANKQYIVDSVLFWQYQPSAAIAQITDRAALTDSGKFIFYANQPALDGNRTFNAKCDRREPNTAILGCYTGDRIYLFDVNDTRLDGIEEVTAAHEMLHAVYQRLSPSDKVRIDGLIEAEYANLQNDADLAERMDFYARTEPGERDNELHSIIGTEVKSVAPELEAHYGKYFKDRKKIVGYYEAYHRAFATLEQQRDDLSDQLDALNAQVKAKSSQYNEATKQLEQDIDEFNQRAQSGVFTSQAQFNRERSTLVTRVEAINNERAEINALVERYDKLKDQYNETVTESNELYQSIDSSLAPAPKV